VSSRARPDAKLEAEDGSGDRPARRRQRHQANTPAPRNVSTIISRPAGCAAVSRWAKATIGRCAGPRLRPLEDRLNRRPVRLGHRWHLVHRIDPHRVVPALATPRRCAFPVDHRRLGQGIRPPPQGFLRSGRRKAQMRSGHHEQWTRAFRAASKSGRGTDGSPACRRCPAAAARWSDAHRDRLRRSNTPRRSSTNARQSTSSTQLWWPWKLPDGQLDQGVGRVRKWSTKALPVPAHAGAPQARLWSV